MFALLCFLLLVFDSSSGAFPLALAGFCCWVEARGVPNVWWERRNSCAKEAQAGWFWAWLSRLCFKGCVCWLEQAAAIYLGVFFQKWPRFFCLLHKLHISWSHLRSVFHLWWMLNGQQATMEMQLSVCLGRGKGNWSVCLEKLMVIAAISPSSGALFCKGPGKDAYFISCKKIHV